MKRLFSLLLTLALALSLAACSRAPSSPTEPANPSSGPSASTGEVNTPTTPMKVCLISTISSGTPFCKLTWRGFEKVQSELGAEIKLIEALDTAEYEEQVRSMAEAGYSPIYTMFDALNAVVVEVAPDYPDTYFYMIDSALEYENLPNVCSLIVDPTESSFISGYVAAKSTTSGTIGWVGSLDQANINRFRNGYTAGALYANPDINILTAYTGDNTDSEKGRECAVAQIDGGADIIFQSANLSGLGVIAGCAEGGIKAIGVDEWQGNVDDCVFWSSLKDIDSAVFETAQEIAGGKFEAGPRYFVLATGARAYDERDFEKLPAELQQEVSDLVEKIVSGEVNVTDLIAAIAN